jgi:hypothetical protein
MSCECTYNTTTNTRCITCSNLADPVSTNVLTQKKIWKQVRTGAAIYTMNIAALTSAAARLANPNGPTNWNQMSDRVVAAVQPALRPTRGNSVRSTVTSSRPGAGSPGGSGVDVKHDSYARYLNRKKASQLKTQNPLTAAATPLYGNKTSMIGLVANSGQCCA